MVANHQAAVRECQVGEPTQGTVLERQSLPHSHRSAQRDTVRAVNGQVLQAVGDARQCRCRRGVVVKDVQCRGGTTCQEAASRRNCSTRRQGVTADREGTAHEFQEIGHVHVTGHRHALAVGDGQVTDIQGQRIACHLRARSIIAVAGAPGEAAGRCPDVTGCAIRRNAFRRTDTEERVCLKRESATAHQIRPTRKSAACCDCNVADGQVSPELEPGCARVCDREVDEVGEIGAEVDALRLVGAIPKQVLETLTQPGRCAINTRESGDLAGRIRAPRGGRNRA